MRMRPPSETMMIVSSDVIGTLPASLLFWNQIEPKPSAVPSSNKQEAIQVPGRMGGESDGLFGRGEDCDRGAPSQGRFHGGQGLGQDQQSEIDGLLHREAQGPGLLRLS